MSLEISQNSQENTYVRVSFLIKLQALGLGTSKNTIYYRTPLVAASSCFDVGPEWSNNALAKFIIQLALEIHKRRAISEDFVLNYKNALLLKLKSTFNYFLYKTLYDWL